MSRMSWLTPFGSVSMARRLMHSAPKPTAPLAQRGSRPLRPLRLHHLGEEARILDLDRLTVDVEQSVRHLDSVARQADQALDEVEPGDRVAEHDDVAALRLAAP